MNIVLAGMMGCGKTTVAEILSRKLGKKSVDTDAEIVKKHGGIADIFSKYGEERFRDIEAETVKDVASFDGVIIATGGGCLLREENVREFKKRGKIVYLRTLPETLIKRVEGDTERPLLAGGAAEKIKSILPVRAPVYESAADIIIDTDNLTPEEVADKITEILK